MKNKLKTFLEKDLKMTFWILVSSLIYSIGITSFSKVGGMYPGGFAGISRIVSDLFLRFYDINIPFGIIYFTINIAPTYLVFRYIGKRFTIYSVLQYIIVSLLTTFYTKPIIVLTDPLLIAVFGGLLCGIGVGVALRNNASSGGTDFIAIYVSNRFNRPIWNYVMCANALVLCVAGVLFGWEKACYSIIFQFVSNQVVQRLHERYKMETLTIITSNPDEVVKNILSKTRHGITEIHSEGAYSHTDNTTLYMVINAFQRHEVVRSILEKDPKAFINIQETIKIVGNYYQKPLD